MVKNLIGKSYQVKHKKAIDPYIENHERFILMRRWADDLTSRLD